ncbi:hypothetical protein [Flavobacterium pedocola]
MLKSNKEMNDVHRFKMKSLAASFKAMQQENRKLENKNRLVSDFESQYQSGMKRIGKEIVDLQHLFLQRITKKNN